MGAITIGCHLSTTGGFEAMGRTALEIGANTFAFFTRNPRGGSAKALDPRDVEALLALMGEHGFGRLVAHAPYTMNLCSATPRTVEFAREAMAGDLERMEALPGNYYNFHPGSHVRQGADRGIELICEGLNQVLVRGQRTRVLLETMAGKGTEVGRSFEELARIIDGTREDQLLGVCLAPERLEEPARLAQGPPREDRRGHAGPGRLPRGGGEPQDARPADDT